MHVEMGERVTVAEALISDLQHTDDSKGDRVKEDEGVWVGWGLLILAGAINLSSLYVT